MSLFFNFSGVGGVVSESFVDALSDDPSSTDIKNSKALDHPSAL